ncbi:MAG: nicotinamide-nucleotide adenylyltransferase [Pyrodictiaceae archaeon]
MKPRRVIYFGRFQPFHLGHLNALYWLLNRFDEVIVLIGMADESHTWKNPFTGQERAQMIYETIREEGLDPSRIHIASIHTMSVYAGHSQYITYMLLGAEAVATANKNAALAFKHAGIKVIEPPLVMRDKYRGEYIRRLMAEGDEEWRHHVPRAVARIIDNIGGVERMKIIFKSMEEHRR